ncbi:MAG: hypothetical protein Kow00124_06820 [Anaerolineae bacterium]
MGAGFLHIPFWRAGGWEDITYRTQLYFCPLSTEPVELGIYLFENGGKAWAGKTFSYEIDQVVSEVTTNAEGMLRLRIGAGQIVRIEVNVLEHEYGTGEVHLLTGTVPVPILARGDLEMYASESSGFEMSVSEISITGGTPVILEPGK